MVRLKPDATFGFELTPLVETATARLKPDATFGFEPTPCSKIAMVPPKPDATFASKRVYPNNAAANSFTDAKRSPGAGLSALRSASDACAGSVGCRASGSAGVPFNMVPSSAGIETASYGSMPVAIS
jgi:hypothetical protein